MRTQLLILFALWTSFAYSSGDKGTTLQKVLDNLENIQTASYYEQSRNWMPGDTLFTERLNRITEYDNPADSTIGASFVEWDATADTLQVQNCYDGILLTSINHEDKEVEIDDFTNRNSPVRSITPPFFTYAKNILRYILSTNDSISVEWEESIDDYHLKLTIYEEEQVEFFGAAYHMPKNPYIWDPISIYELWIGKSNELPYKVRREMSHNTWERVCRSPELNKSPIKSIQVSDYFPLGYYIYKKGDKRRVQSGSTILGKQAPDWTLNDMNEYLISLSDLKSKVIVMNFTGIGCGPCMIAIPFLNSLKELFPVSDCEVISVESWKNKIHSLGVYAIKNRINYKFLEGNDAIIKDYLNNNRGVPVFIILDEKRTVRKIINGYNPETTGQEIVKTIKEVLSST